MFVPRLTISVHKLEPNICIYRLFSQLKVFSTLKFHDGKAMVDTFRPVQPLHGRQVYRSGGAVLLASTTFLVVAAAMALGLSQPN